MRFMSLAAIAAAVFVVQPAVAQDAPPVEPPVAPDVPGKDPLTGLRVEAAAGYDRLEAYYIEDDTKYYDGANGIRYGSEIGYDFAIGSVVAGAYASYTGSSVDRCDDLDVFVLCQQAGNEIAVGGRVGGRIGYASQLYAKLGYSQLTLNLSAAGTAFEETYRGVQYGIGGEYGIGNGAYLKAEVIGSSFGTGDTIYEDLNFERRSVTVGLGYRF
ncbi:outer membrane beta-barrel protein [Sphingomonas silueang]|uniref:outer membrane beta-barrel protein n=1 Tax=Sphingomonas silueang TaxID=3156617 RepID=UPI0032B4BE9F